MTHSLGEKVASKHLFSKALSQGFKMTQNNHRITIFVSSKSVASLKCIKCHVLKLKRHKKFYAICDVL